VETPFWVAVNVWLAIVREVYRVDVVVLAETEYVTVPFPVPLAPDAMVIQVLLLAAHEQVLCVATVIDMVPPEDGNVWLAGDMV
jgi:hypothetical protein